MNNKPMDIMNDDGITRLAYTHALYRDFWNWCKAAYPVVHKQFCDEIKSNDDLVKEVFKHERITL